MNHLIYLCCFGDSTFKTLTDLCVRSLRESGKFHGQVIIFTNNGYQAPDLEVESIPVPGILDLFDIRAFKAAAAEYIEEARYDNIMSMDSDMIAIEDINPLFDYCGDSICAMEETPWTEMNGPSCGTCLTPRERILAWGRWGINAGLLCSPAHLFRGYMDMWLNEMRIQRERLRTWINQPPINALVLRRKLRFKAFPREWIDMPPMYSWFGGTFKITPETRILHFCWTDKQQSIRDMQAFVHRDG